MTRIGIILGSTRPNRNGEQVAKWVYDIASRRSDAEFELVDLRDYPLPHLDEPLPPSMGQYQNEHTKQWADKIASFDGFVIVTPEYNHGTSGVLKNAIDYLYAEWNNKAVGFVSYGAVGGARAAEHLRLIAGELQMADVRQQVALSLLTEFENFSVFKPGDYNVAALDTLLDQVVAWSTALAPLREPRWRRRRACRYASRLLPIGESVGLGTRSGRVDRRVSGPRLRDVRMTKVLRASRTGPMARTRSSSSCSYAVRSGTTASRRKSASPEMTWHSTIAGNLSDRVLDEA